MFPSRLLLALVTILLSVFCQGQTLDTKIADIRREFNRINSIALQQVTLQNEEFMDQMTDGGGELIGYFENKRLVKYTERIGISIGAYDSHFYLRDGELFFAYLQEQKFAQKEGGQLGDLDRTKLKTVFEGRYYFHSGEVIREIETGQRLFGSGLNALELLERVKGSKALLESKRNE